MAPILCMITDGSHAAGSDDGALVRAVRDCAHAGAHLIQIREHGVEAGHLARLVAACVEAVTGTRARVLVNDRLDVALAARAHGVHLRETSIPPREVRTICPAGFLVGRSVHTAADAARLGRDGGLDYLIFGAVFATPSKPGAPAAGLDALRLAVRGTTLPVLAVGGVNVSNAADVGATGAAGLAAIRWWTAPRQETVANGAQDLSAAFAVGAASRR
jgi:thiamine-phosphate diphosphorylase